MWPAIGRLALKLAKFVAPVVLQEVAGSLVSKGKKKLEEILEKRRQQKEQKEAEKEGK